MKTIWLVFAVLVAPFLASAQSKSLIYAETIKGDFNGDGKQETLWIKKPQLTKDGMSCIGPCVIKIMCSNPKITPITLKQAIGGTLCNFGDMNGDGCDDIGLLPAWFTSCWSAYHTYTYEHAWKPLVPAFSTHCNQWEKGIVPIEKIKGKPGYLKVNYSDFKEDIVFRSKVVKSN